MAIRKVARLGHPVLRSPTRDVTPQEIRSPEMRRLVADMIETMHEYGGVGLAAPQVHESIRLAVLEFDGDSDRYPQQGDQPLLVVWNARVSVIDPTPSGFWEDCMSVPGLRGYVELLSKVRVDYLDDRGQPQRLTADGFLATVLQHELDHLDGVLYVDRIKDPARFAFIEEYQRYHLAPGEPEVAD